MSPRALWIALALSLVVNVFVVGAAAGLIFGRAFASPSGPGPHPNPLMAAAERLDPDASRPAHVMHSEKLTLGFSGRNVLTDITVSLARGSITALIGPTGSGKSTFLRSVGTAQLMMQAGMFVTADAFTANVRSGIFTHFTREEDATLTHGRLDEELTRMSTLVDHILERTVCSSVLYLDLEIAIPEIVAPAHQIEGEHNETTRARAGGNVGQQLPPNGGGEVLDATDGIDTVEGR